MEHKQKLDELHKQSLESADEFIKSKGELSEQDKEKINNAKKEWQEAWNKFQEALLYIERLEI
jgi:hypothetical protein